jgi:hypothetical protein
LCAADGYSEAGRPLATTIVAGVPLISVSLAEAFPSCASIAQMWHHMRVLEVREMLVVRRSQEPGLRQGS